MKRGQLSKRKQRKGVLIERLVVALMYTILVRGRRTNIEIKQIPCSHRFRLSLKIAVCESMLRGHWHTLE